MKLGKFLRNSLQRDDVSLNSSLEAKTGAATDYDDDADEQLLIGSIESGRARRSQTFVKCM